MSAHILIVEDEEAIARGLAFNFEQEGYTAVVHGDGPSALSYFDEHAGEIDCVVLDLMLPGMSGYEVCRAIRDRDGLVPVLVLSARMLSEDKAYAFGCGTDQYMTKPFNLPELLSRVKNLLDRRHRMARLTAPPITASTLPVQYDFGSVQVDFGKFQLRKGEQVSALTTHELQLLRYFCEHEGIVLPRQRILRDVWEQSSEVTTRTIDNFVMRLRKYIEDDPAKPRHLLSVRGTGYRFVAQPEDTTEAEGTT
ncbi:MAG: response regulator transcription factor [Pirellulales bacterium]